MRDESCVDLASNELSIPRVDTIRTIVVDIFLGTVLSVVDKSV